MHHPLFTSDVRPFDNSDFADRLRPLWRAFYQGGGDVTLVGHSHFYERFAPQDPNERRNRRGVRQFIVGTGGRNVYGFGAIEPNSEVRGASTFGVLQMALHRSSYDWRFVPIPGESFTDRGTSRCQNGRAARPDEPRRADASAAGVRARSARMMDAGEAAPEDSFAIGGLVGGGVAAGDDLSIRGHAELPGQSRETDPAARFECAIGKLVGPLRDLGPPDVGRRSALRRIARVRRGATDRVHPLRPDRPDGRRNDAGERDRRNEQRRPDAREAPVRRPGRRG
jgi:hypothetical protein